MSDSDYGARLSAVEARLIETANRLSEVESHIPRIGASEGDIAVLASKLGALVYEVGELRNIVFNLINTARKNHEETNLKLDILVEQGRLQLAKG